ncbi:hypothetical protein FMM01_07690 [Schleiferilactobacillus harbinensis]|uniref:O-antigen ligase family protein n=1 Tax=Schleiferilactobacillus harbinensis TaxID=304207 RepID=UPI00123959AA|nr:O-antigen ligase family protein [Schleiferilactobacillus harbinensis]QEU47184.1 hypothetical protein FMM01_07690 [Schleiferilactobacillus harbinensis]
MHVRKILHWALIAYILIQPFMEIIYFYQGRLATLGPVTIPTFVRVLWTLAMVLLFLWMERKDKFGWGLFAYGVLVVGYLGLHVFLTRHALAGVTDGFHYSISTELGYVIRVLFPILILIISYRVPVYEKTMEWITWVVGLLFSGTIVLSNLLEIAVASYNKAESIQGNIFDWFNAVNPLGYTRLASDGFFLFANTTSAILALFSVLMIYYLINQPRWWKYCFVAVQLLASLMIGTRTAIIGFLASLILVTGAALFFDKLHFRKQDAGLLSFVTISMLVFGFLYPYSPAVARGGSNTAAETRTTTQRKSQNPVMNQIKRAIKDDPQDAQRLQHNFVATQLNIVTTYGNVVSATNPWEHYPADWFQLMNWPGGQQINYRQVEKFNVNIIAREMSKPIRLLFGISYTRMTYFIFNYERDFLNQFYTLGILGLLIFQLPFIIACLWLAWRFFRTPGQFNFLNFSYLLGMALFFASAFMTGNVIDSLTAASLAAFFLGQRLRAVAWSQDVPEQQNTIPRQIN